MNVKHESVSPGAPITLECPVWSVACAAGQDPRRAGPDTAGSVGCDTSCGDVIAAALTALPGVAAEGGCGAAGQVTLRCRCVPLKVSAVPLCELGSALVDHVRNAPCRPSECGIGDGRPSASGMEIRSSRIGVEHLLLVSRRQAMPGNSFAKRKVVVLAISWKSLQCRGIVEGCGKRFVLAANSASVLDKPDTTILSS